MEIAGAMEADDEVGTFFRNLKEIHIKKISMLKILHHIMNGKNIF